MGTNDLNPGIDYCSLESFVVALYRKQKVPAEVATLADLRWYYFSKHQSESHKMPPTYGALHEKILRSHFTALQWKSAHLCKCENCENTNSGHMINVEDHLIEEGDDDI